VRKVFCFCLTAYSTLTPFSHPRTPYSHHSRRTHHSHHTHRAYCNHSRRMHHSTHHTLCRHSHRARHSRRHHHRQRTSERKGEGRCSVRVRCRLALGPWPVGCGRSRAYYQLRGAMKSAVCQCINFVSSSSYAVVTACVQGGTTPCPPY